MSNPCFDPIDPCKPFGCALQQCYIDMQRLISRASYGINDKGWCGTEREKLDQCREEFLLPGSRAHAELSNNSSKTNPTSTNDALPS